MILTRVLIRPPTLPVQWCIVSEQSSSSSQTVIAVVDVVKHLLKSQSHSTRRLGPLPGILKGRSQDSTRRCSCHEAALAVADTTKTCQTLLPSAQTHLFLLIRLDISHIGVLSIRHTPYMTTSLCKCEIKLSAWTAINLPTNIFSTISNTRFQILTS